MYSVSRGNEVMAKSPYPPLAARPYPSFGGVVGEPEPELRVWWPPLAPVLHRQFKYLARIRTCQDPHVFSIPRSPTIPNPLGRWRRPHASHYRAGAGRRAVGR